MSARIAFLIGSLGSLALGCAAELKRGVPRESEVNSPENNPNVKLDPTKARAFIGNVDTMHSASTNSPNFKVPGFSLTLQNAQFAQIMRCAATYVLDNGAGTPLAEAPRHDPRFHDWSRWAWQTAHANSDKCQTVGLTVARPEFTDLAAPLGMSSFYYVINPCVEFGRMIPGHSDNCSYDLVITNTVTFQNRMEAAAVTAARALASAEGELYAAYSNLYSQAQLAKVAQDVCEENWAMNRAAQARMVGVIKLIGVGVGMYVNTVAAGAGTVLMNALSNLSSESLSRGNSAPVCPQTEYHLEQIEKGKSAAQQAVQAVLQARQELSKVESEYAPLEQQALDYFKTSSN